MSGSVMIPRRCRVPFIPKICQHSIELYLRNGCGLQRRIPVNLILDACTFICKITDESRLSPKAKILFADPEHDVCLSVPSTWEIHKLRSIESQNEN